MGGVGGALRGLVSSVVVMGGAVRCDGNMGKDGKEAELNFYSDPKAASVVFGAGLPLTLLDLSVANDSCVAACKACVAGLVRLHPPLSPAGEAMATLVEAFPDCAGYDSIAVASLLVPEAFEMEPDVRVKLIEASGATEEAADGSRVTLASSVDLDQYLGLLRGCVVAGDTSGRD